MLKGLDSKNCRTRSECLEEIGVMIERNGPNAFSPSKTLPVIAMQIADRDSSVRNAALNAVANVHNVLGDAVWRFVGGISEKDKSLLEERIKRRREQQVESAADDHSAAIDSLPVLRKAAASEKSAEPRTALNKKFSLDLDGLGLPELQTADHLSTSNRQSISANDEIAFDLLFTQVTSGDAFQSIEALKTLEKHIQTRPSFVAVQLNQLVNSIILQIRLAFTSPSLFSSDSTTLIRLCKHLINVLVQIFTNTDLALELGADTMHQLLSELLVRLIDPALQKSLGENGSQLVRALNVLMLRILENCNRNRVFRYIYTHV